MFKTYLAARPISKAGTGTCFTPSDCMAYGPKENKQTVRVRAPSVNTFGTNSHGGRANFHVFNISRDSHTLTTEAVIAPLIRIDGWNKR